MAMIIAIPKERRAAEIPPSLAGLGARAERVTVLPNSTAAVKEFILEQTRQR